jgi:hypothetical protein
MARLSFHYRSGITALVLLGACSGKKPEAAPPAAPTTAGATGAAMSPTSTDMERLVLDSANTMFRAKNYAAALEGYRRAAAVAPDDIAPWFGVYMVAAATKDKALGETASAEMKARGGAPSEGDTATLKAHQGTKPTSTIH